MGDSEDLQNAVFMLIEFNTKIVFVVFRLYGDVQHVDATDRWPATLEDLKAFTSKKKFLEDC